MATPAGPPTPTNSLNDLRRRATPKVPKRRLTMRERRWKLLQTVVPWLLTLVFGVTSVGMFMTFRQPNPQAMAPEDHARRLTDRLKTEKEQVIKEPNDPQWPYSVSKTDIELAQSATGKPDDVKKYKADAAEALRATLKIDPSYPPALKDLAHMDLDEGNATEAVDLLTAGIRAEALAIDKINKSRGKDDPEVFPDATLRALLFNAYMVEGGHDKEAQAAALEGMRLNPNEFSQYLRQMTLLAALRQNKEMATKACSMALDAAKQLNDPAAVDDVQQVKKMVDSIQTQASVPPNVKEMIEKARKSKGGSPAPGASGAPAGSPAAETSGAPVEPAAASAAPVTAEPAAASASPAEAAPASASPAAAASSPAPTSP